MSDKQASSIQSMTAYAVIERNFRGRSFKFHLKSVNHRFTEVRARMPRSLMAFETELKTLLPRKLVRGSIDFWLEDCGTEQKQEEVPVQKFFTQLRQAVQDSKDVKGLGIPGPLRAVLLARYPQVWLKENGDDFSFSKEEFFEVIEELTNELISAREKEGAQISEALKEYLSELRSLRDTIAQHYPELRKEWESSLQERLKKLAEDLQIPPVSDERLLQELLILAEKRDVAEELQRIQGHLNALNDLLTETPKNLGRRLEFLLQELHREWTTLGNKIQNVEASKQVVEAKISIEKIREQSLNLV